jgi:hypothetical protein
VFLALIIIIASGIAHGLCSDRWSTAEELPAAVARMDRLPTTLDDWDGSDVELEPGATQRAEIAGSLVRRYVQRSTGQEMLVMLVCGRPGPISVHTPDVCYQGAGYRMAGNRARQQVALPSGETVPFWKASFVKESFPGKDELRIWWSWHAGGAWQTAGEPRLAFARFPVLHKLYVIYRVSWRDRSAADPTPAFAQRLLAELKRTVFAAEG